ncbi:MAG: 2Fe-2S iron-sulfur cluster-binding protein [Alphaproteobacteria bacterium]
MKIRFVTAGGETREVPARPGETLLARAQEAGFDLEGACGGQMACSTCHVIVAREDFHRLARASAEERELLSIAPGATPFSRLACQVILREADDGITVQVPHEHENLWGK